MNNGVCTIDMWVCLDETGPVFISTGKESEWFECHKQTCLTRDARAAVESDESCAEQEFNGLEEGQDCE